jgi:hypothetical protein
VQNVQAEPEALLVWVVLHLLAGLHGQWPLWQLLLLLLLLVGSSLRFINDEGSKYFTDSQYTSLLNTSQELSYH